MLMHFSDLLCNILSIDPKYKYDFEYMLHLLKLRAESKSNDKEITTSPQNSMFFAENQNSMFIVAKPDADIYYHYNDNITLNINLFISCHKTKFKLKHLRTFVHSQIIECDKYVQSQSYEPVHVPSITVTL